jgi:glycosyltransferase involved in cell wall biosynthesis
MLISVVTPVLNGARTIDRALRSLAVQEAEFEHIVMDGGSTDETEAIVRRYEPLYPVTWHSQRDNSIYEGLWNGFERSTGEVMGSIGADDFYLPSALATVSAVFERHPEVEWITGIPSWYLEESKVSRTAPYAPVFPQWMIRRGLASSRLLGWLQLESLFWRRSLWERAKPYDILHRDKYAADFHLWRRFAEHARLRSVAAALSSFTISERQVSGRFRQHYLEEAAIRTKTMTPPAIGRVTLRLISTAMSGTVIDVADVNR